MPDAAPSNVYLLRYKFQFENGEFKDFEVPLNEKTLEVIHQPAESIPEWAKLKYNQCENCPLKDDVEYCPVAVNIAHLVNEFQFSASFDKALVLVESPERTYGRETTVQHGLSAILGIYMVTSNCPVLDKLRPMVRFHLPFASANETIYRAMSMYLVAQFFRVRKGLQPDWSLQGLVNIYRAIGLVNMGMWKRLSKASDFDANVNAIIVLNTFGDALRFSLEQDLDGIESLFGQYLQESPA